MRADGADGTPAEPTTTTSVAIVGAGPAGLALARGLRDAGVACAVVEKESRSHLEGLPRAGYLEEWAVAALARRGLADPLRSGAQLQGECEFRLEGERYVFGYGAVSGHHHVVYPQQDLVRDLLQGYVDEAGGDIRFGATGVRLHGLRSDRPAVSYTDGATGERHTVRCDTVVGCDGARGVSRQAAVDLGARVLRHDLGVRWLTLLAEARPPSDRVVFGLHRDGFAMYAARGPHATRYYMEVAAAEAADAAAAADAAGAVGADAAGRPDERLWDALEERLGARGAPGLVRGRFTEKRVLDMHNYVVEPMACGRLLLAGDAAHLLAPIAAKGMNLALNDAFLLTDALADHHRRGDDRRLAGYSAAALRRVWQYQEFTEWLSAVMHGPSSGDPFRARLAAARLHRLAGSETAARSVAELYLGTSMETSMETSMGVFREAGEA